MVDNQCMGLLYAKIDPSDLLLNQCFRKYYWRLEKLVLSRFVWDVPLTCDNREIERTLFYSGRVLIFRDSFNGQIYSLPFNALSGDNMYREPVEREAYADTGYHRRATMADSVIIWDNYTRVPPVIDVADAAATLAEIESTMRINVNAQKTPYILKGVKRMRQTLETLFTKIVRNKPVIYLDNDVELEKISVLNTDTPERYLTLRELLERTWNDTLVSLGISTVNTWKKERLVGSEADAADDMADAFRLCEYRSRMEGVEKLRKMFPEHNWNIDYNFVAGGDVYGDVHDGDIRVNTGTDRTDSPADDGRDGEADRTGG